MRKRLSFCAVLILFATLSAFWADHKSLENGQEEAMALSELRNSNDVITVSYHKDGIEAGYPKLVAGGSMEELVQWNKLIYHDFEKILDIYSFHPLLQPTPSPGTSTPTILKMGYEIKENTDRILSIFYLADFNSPYSAHPTELVYTTNISKTESKRIRFKDYVRLNGRFVENFRTWKIIQVEPGNEELNKAIRNYLADLSNEDLLKGFQAADQIGSANLYNIYSYQTPEKLGISIEAPNYLGDHIELEQDKSELKEFLLME